MSLSLFGHYLEAYANVFAVFIRALCHTFITATQYGYLHNKWQYFLRNTSYKFILSLKCKSSIHLGFIFHEPFQSF